MSLAGSIAKDSVRATMLTVLAKGMGFLLPVFIAYYFGATGETDAFFLAYAIPVFINQTTIMAMNSGIVPILSGLWFADESRREALMGSLLATCIAFFCLAAGFYYFFAPTLIEMVGAKFPPEARMLAGSFAAHLTPVVFLGGLSGLYSSVYFSKKSFTLPMLAPGFKALASTLTIVLFHRHGMYAVAWGLIAGELVQLAALRLGLSELKFSSARRLGLDPRVREVLFLAVPMIFVMVVNQMNTTVDKFMAAVLETGSVSYLDYADRVYMVPLTLFGTGFLRVLLPHWSHAYSATGEMKEIEGSLSSIISTLVFYMAPLVMLIFLFRLEVVSLVFHQGAMTFEKVRRISTVLGFMLPGFIPQVLGIVFLYVHLATRQARVIIVTSSVSLCLNVVFNYIFMQRFGINGIALSTSAVQLVFFVLMFFIGHKELKFLRLAGDRRLITDLLKVLAGLCAMVSVRALWGLLPVQGENIVLSVIAALAVTLSYVALAAILKPSPFTSPARIRQAGNTP